MSTNRLFSVFPVALALIATAACGSSTSSAPAKLSLKQVFEQAAPGTVELHGKRGQDDVGGTGVIIDGGKGLILTNAHVVQGVAALKARINDQTETSARILGIAPCDDLAVVQLPSPPAGLKPIAFGDSKALKHEDVVVALGYPASFADQSTEKIVSTNGTVQQPDLAATPDKSLPKYPSLIQHSATINPGNSGGPLLNERAELVGINTLGNSGTSNQPVQSQYYAISLDHVKAVLPDLLKGKSTGNAGWNLEAFSQVPLADVFAATGYGTAEQGKAVDEALAAQKVDGVFVDSADPGSPADDAKITGGDLITTIQGTPVATVEDVCNVLQSATPSQTLSVSGRYLTSGGPDHNPGDPWSVKVTLK